MTPRRIFLLSPANASGRRGQLLRKSPNVDLARRLRSDEGAPLGEVFAFISGLYFRGKLAYARAFAPDASFIITSNLGLVSPDLTISSDTLHGFGNVPIDAAEPRYLEPLARDLAHYCADACEVVLLGSVASPKYTTPLLAHFGARLLFPSAFVGRGDMSRGGLMLRAVTDGVELDYVSVQGATLHGARPPKLPPRPR